MENDDELTELADRFLRLTEMGEPSMKEQRTLEAMKFHRDFRKLDGPEKERFWEILQQKSPQRFESLRTILENMKHRNGR